MATRLRPRGRIALDMTPLIDIVFQLLIFFILTLRITEPEGDFALRMPLPKEGDPIAYTLPPMRVALAAADDGSCASVTLNGYPVEGPDRWRQLHDKVERLIVDENGTADIEVVLACDPNLHYQETIAAITALSGELDQRGHVVPLVKNIRFP